MKLSKGESGCSEKIDAGDELEKLGHRLNTMARSLSRGRDNLEER